MARVSKKGPKKWPFFPPLWYVFHLFSDTRKAANKVLLEICQTKEDLDITVTCRFWPLDNCLDLVWLHLDALWRDNEAEN